MIDFWGLGYDIAEKMGLLPDIARVGYHVQELRIVDDDGLRLSGFGVQVFREFTSGRYITLGRSELSKLIYDRISGSCEIIFGDSITSLRETHGEVQVEFEHGGERQFDLVIGADGLHSRARELVFCPQDRYEKDLGYRVAAFEIGGYRPRNELVYLVHSAPGRQVGRFSLHNDRTLFLLIFDVGGEPQVHGAAAQNATLRKRFAGDGWELHRILPALDTCTELYFNRVSQIHMGALVARPYSAGRRCGLLCVPSRRPGLGFGDDGGLCSGRRTGYIARPPAGGIQPVRGTVATLHPCQAASGPALCGGVRSADSARGSLPQ
jgi:2-polyprenyl-6-methoxyphenol hydroxylase-like FAD-dependent oxidoreductase